MFGGMAEACPRRPGTTFVCRLQVELWRLLLRRTSVVPGPKAKCRMSASMIAIEGIADMAGRDQQRRS
jgi:hypothetical protein